MKQLFIFLLFPFLATSQTVTERQKITSSYNQSEILALKSFYEDFHLFQQQKIIEFKKTNPFIESELMSLQRIEDDGTPIFYSILNAGSSKTIGTNKMYPGGSLGLNVTGDGMFAGVWDGGKVRETHQEFNGGKVILGDAASTSSSHATHVTGTIMASGFSPLRKGIAYGALAKTFDWTTDYNEMLSFGAEGYLVSTDTSSF